MPVAPTIFDDQEFAVVRWVDETGNGLKANIQRFADCTVQATGTGTVTLEGTMDGTNWEPLKAIGASPPVALSLAAANAEMAVVLEHPSMVRAVVTGGTATVTILCNSGR